jgi:hypothetical protein
MTVIIRVGIERFISFTFLISGGMWLHGGGGTALAFGTPGHF